jgi:hypothetical protein
MLAHGFTIEQLVELGRAGLITATADRVVHRRPRVRSRHAADHRSGAEGTGGDGLNHHGVLLATVRQLRSLAAVCFFGGRGIALEIAVGRAECESERASEMVEPRLRRGADCESDLHPLATRLGHFGQRRHIPVRHP